MKEIILAIVFTFPGVPYPQLVDGYFPRTQPDYDTCIERGEFLRDYLEANPQAMPKGSDGYLIMCIRKDIEGRSA